MITIHHNAKWAMIIALSLSAKLFSANAAPVYAQLMNSVLINAKSSAEQSSISSNSTALQHLENVLAKEQGNVVYIDFWASWCGPCVKSFPWMNDLQQRYQQQGFSVISINLDSDKAQAEQFLQAHPALFSVIYDANGTLAKYFNIKGMPTSMLIDRDGKIQYRHSGFLMGKTDSYENEIKQLINKRGSNET